jgi:hypothetical protein
MNIKTINKILSIVLIVFGGLLFFSWKFFNILGFDSYITPYLFMILGLVGLLLTAQLNTINNLTYSTLFLVGVSLFLSRNFEILDVDKLIFYSWLIFPSTIIIKLGFDLDNNKFFAIGFLYFIILYSLNALNNNITEFIILTIHYYLIELFPIVIIVLGAYILSKNSN